MNAQENCNCLSEGKALERNGHTSSCNRLTRKIQSEANKPPKQKKAIAKVGKNNTFECSDGTKVTQADINSLRDKMYNIADAVNHHTRQVCSGCHIEFATCHAHIIAQARCKVLRKTELIWDKNNIFNSCFDCNAIAENISSPAIMQLKNYQRIKEFMIEMDYERATKLPDFKLTEPHAI